MRNRFTLPVLLVTAAVLLAQSFVPLSSTAQAVWEQAGLAVEQTILPPAEWGNPLAELSAPHKTSDKKMQTESVAPMAAFIVSNLNDSGPGSLRQAILDANAAIGPDEITFDPSIRIIRPQAPLPEITDPVTIDGGNHVEINGSNAGAANGLVITAGNSVVKQLAIGSFSGNAISLQQRGNNVIENNHLGTDATGTLDRGNGGEGVNIQNSNNNTVRSNTIVFNADGGSIIDSVGNLIDNNNLGTDATMTRNMGNRGAGFGFLNSSSNRFESNRASFNRIGFVGFGGFGNLFGGEDPTLGNIIGGNDTGVLLNSSNGNTFQANFVGTNALGQNLGNKVAGVDLAGTSSNNRLGTGPVNTINWIAFNTVGINVATSAVGNLFLFNRFFDNNESIRLNENANRKITAPTLTSAESSNNQTTIRGTYSSGVANSQFVIQIYLDPMSTPTRGKNPLGSITVTTNGAGQADIGALFSAPLPGGVFLSALATNPITGDTSGFGEPTLVNSLSQIDLKVEKTGPQIAKCGDTVSYTIVTTNVGAAAAIGASIVDLVPPCIAEDFTVTTTPPGLAAVTYGRLASDVPVLVPRLNPGESVTITITGVFTERCAERTTNTAFVDADGDSRVNNNSSTVLTLLGCTRITGLRIEGKHVFVTGVGFQKGDEVDINGEVRVGKLQDDGSLKVKKGAKLLLTCDPANPGRTNIIRLIRTRDPGAPIIDTEAFATCP